MGNARLGYVMSRSTLPPPLGKISRTCAMRHVSGTCAERDVSVKHYLNDPEDYFVMLSRLLMLPLPLIMIPDLTLILALPLTQALYLGPGGRARCGMRYESVRGIPCP